MDNKIAVELGDIQRTLFMPVWARAVETKKGKPFLIDKTAEQIIENVDYDFSHMKNNIPEISQISWIARCKRFDLIIKDFIKRHPHSTVVNIGCGLDTTFERINNPDVLWYDLDLQDVIKLRKKFLNENENRKFIASSFLDRSWLDQIIVRDKVLFVATGVFVYFEEQEIKGFILNVAEHFPGAELIFDVTSPKGVEIGNMVIEKSGLDSRSFFKWGLQDKSVITSWDSRLRIINTYHTFKIDGLELSEENAQIAMISDSLDIMYMIHLGIE